MNMNNPVLSIVIPTCDRPDTLEVCLRALERQPNPDVEILVQDNACDERTSRILKQSCDMRIVHNRSETRISMRNNFEDGVAAARGDYITIIGDDDAFCAGAIDWIVSMLKAHRPLALRWNLAVYLWPSLSDANLGFFHLHYNKFYGGWTWRDAQSVTQSMLDGRMEGLWESLQIYHGAVSRKLCDETQNRTAGTLFQYHIPDVYVHTALLLTAGQFRKARDRLFIDVRHPLSIYGISGHSNGSSWFAGRSEKRGEVAPVTRWERAAAADTKVIHTVLNPIRCVKYHDYAALMLAVSLGLVSEQVIDHDRWHHQILQEVNGNKWQIRGFHKAEPQLPYERNVIDKVKFEFGPLLTHEGEVEPNRLKHLHDECWRWQQLCLISAAPSLPDDVDTAVTVLDSITDATVGLKPAENLRPSERRRLRLDLGLQLQELYNKTPPFGDRNRRAKREA